MSLSIFSSFFFFTDTAPTEIYTLSLHDALPIYGRRGRPRRAGAAAGRYGRGRAAGEESGLRQGDRKSTRLNSSHSQISYAVFCLKKKKKQNKQTHILNAPAYIQYAHMPSTDASS